MNEKQIDLVLEGGGVKGIGIAGAYSVLEKSAYTFHRIAGSSAGAVMASLIAAGYSAQELKEIADMIDYRKFPDPGFIDRFGIAGKTLSLLFEKGVFEGRYVHQLVLELLEKKGIRTFGDLKIAQPESADIRDAYKLVVVATDVTRAKLIRLPWDYHEYGLDPDTQLVADAIRASAAIPFYFEPSRLGDSYVVDGSVTANFPIWLFEDGPHQHHPVRPTIGVKLSSRETMRGVHEDTHTTTTFDYAFSILELLLEAQDHAHLNEPCTIRRTMFVDAEDIQGMDFAITKAQRERLYQNGITAAEKFLNRWDYKDFIAMCRG